MILSIEVIKDAAALATIADQIQQLSWQDGRETAGAQARKVKQNEQAIMSDEAGQALRQSILPLVTENAVLLAASRPRRFSHFLVSKTADGGHYGSHIDNALMGTGAGRMRSDLSFTLFLTPRENYEGGDLVIHQAGAAHTVAGNLGELVLYPSNTIHEVTPVTSGERIVAVGWIESLIADGPKRELLFDLENLRSNLRAKADNDPAELLTLDKSIANLVRMWAHP